MKERFFRARATLLVALLGTLVLSSAPVFAGAKNVEPVLPAPKTLSKDKPFDAVAAGPTELQAGDSFLLRYTIHIVDKNHYIYKERTSLSVEAVDGISFREPSFATAPERKYDDLEQKEMEIYHGPATLYVEGTVAKDAKPGPRTVKGLVKYQGCNPTVCFFPTKKELPLTFTIVDGSASATGAGTQSASPEGSVQSASSGSTTTGSPEGGTDTSSLDGGSHEGGSHEGGSHEGGSLEGGSLEGGSPEGGSLGSSSNGASMQAGSTVGVGSGATGKVAPPDGQALQASSGAISSDDTLNNALKQGILWTFLMVFGLGILASFTPCIYPIIPITISVLGARKAKSKLHGFSLALVYVLGISVTYTALGMFAALTGSLFGAWMQSKWVVGGVAVLFIAMGFSMLGAFSTAMPSSVSSRLSRDRGPGVAGAFFTGTVAGLVASPCVGPLIVSLLTYIAQTKDVALGAALMFTFAFGMGQLFLLLGTFAISMPKSGAWMDVVKGALALLLFAMGLYYLQTVIPSGYYELLVGVAAITAGTFVGAFTLMNADASTGMKMRKVAGVLFVVVGVYSTVGGLVGLRVLSPELSAMMQPRAGDVDQEATAGIRWLTDYDAGMALAQEKGAPVLLDFRADWCAACKELEHNTYTDADVISASKEYVPIKLDGTRETAEFTALKEKYGVWGLPAVLFVAPDGSVAKDLTVTGFVSPEEFLGRMCKVQGAQAARLQHVCRG